MTVPGAGRHHKLRLFFALWPAAAERAALADAAAPAVARVDGQAVPPANLHVTLAFVGMVSEQVLARLVELGGRGPWPSVSLDFARIEYWAQPRVLVAMPDEAPAAGQEIVERLLRGIEPLNFTRDARPWHPHLTLVRRIRLPPPGPLMLAPVKRMPGGPAWRLALVESCTHPDGPLYKPLADWPLEKGDVPL